MTDAYISPPVKAGPPENEGYVSPTAKEYSTIRGGAVQFLSGFNERIANLLDAPRLLAEATIGDKVGEYSRSIIGEEATQNIYEASQYLTVGKLMREIGSISETKPQGAAERVAKRAGQEVGATVPYTMLGFAAPEARAIGAAAPSVAREVYNSFVRATQANPWATLAAETASSTGAGTGAGIAQEVAPGSAGAEMTGQLVGGFAPAALTMTPLAITIRGGKWFARAVGEQATTERAKKAAQEVIGGEMTETAKQNLREAEGLREEIPGFNPTLAEETGSRGLTATQEGLEGQMKGAELEQAATRRQQSEQAINQYAAEDFSGFEADPDFVVDTATGRVSQVRDRAEAQMAGVQERAEGVAATLPKTDRQAAGAELRALYRQKRQDARDRMKARSQELGIADDDLTEELEGLYYALRSDYDNRPATARRPPRDVLEDVEADLRKAGVFEEDVPEDAVPYTLQNLLDFRVRLGDDIRDALSGSAQDRQRAMELIGVKEKIDDILDGLPGDEYAAFRKEYFDNYILPFERGVAYKTRQQDGRGFYQTNDEKVADLYFKAGDDTAADQFKLVFGDDAQAQNALTNVALDKLRDAAVKDGRIDPKRLADWVKKHESVMDRLPFVRERVASYRDAVNALEARQAQIQSRIDWVQDHALAKIIGKNPQTTINAAVKNPRQMATLLKGLKGNEAALNSLRKHVWDQVADGTGEEIDAFIVANRKALQQLFPVEHLNKLRAISRARTIMARTKPPKGAAYTTDPLARVQEATGLGLSQGISRLYAYASGRLNKAYLTSEAAGRFMQGRSRVQTAALLKEALYNKAVANDLRKAAFMSTEPPEINRRFNAHLFNLGLMSREAPSEEDK